MATITIRYYASARAASGVSEEYVVASNVADAVSAARRRHGEQLSKILEVSSLLLDGQVVHDPVALVEGHVHLDVLPPFAGG
jgi:molybdopterin synthase sulfur carrier subunit